MRCGGLRKYRAAAGILTCLSLPGGALGVGLGSAWAATWGRLEALPGSVELVVRSYSSELPVLLLFLRSVEMYWPWDHALVVLDETEADRRAATALPSWCRIVYEATPPHWDKYIPVRYGKGKPFSTGYVRAQWSMFQLDKYTECEYIAFFDSDVVIFTFVTPSVLFSDVGKAIVKGHRGAPMFFRALSILGWQFVAEFMQDFPLVLHRSTFSLARRQVTRAATGVGTRCWNLGLCRHWNHLVNELGPRKDWGFDEAFLWLNSMLNLYGRRGIDDSTILPCAQSILGHVAWHNQRSLYSWSIMDEGLLAGFMGHHGEFEMLHTGESGALRSLPQEVRCPSLSVSFHLGHYNSDEMGRGSAEYFSTGRGMIQWGVCDVEHDYELVWERGGCVPQDFATKVLVMEDRPYDTDSCAAKCWIVPECTNFFLSRSASQTCMVTTPGCRRSETITGWDYYSLRSRSHKGSEVRSAEGQDLRCWAAECAKGPKSWGCRPDGSLNELLSLLSDAFRLSWARTVEVPRNCTPLALLLASYRKERAAVLRSLGPMGRKLLLEVAAGGPQGPPPAPISRVAPRTF